MKWIDKISYWIDQAIRSFITVFLSLMTIIMLVQIIGRFVFNSGIVWTDEISRYLMVWLVFLGAAVATRDWSHISVSVLEENSKTMKKILPPIQKIFMLIYTVVVIKFGYDILDIVANQASPNAGISMAIVYSVFPLSCIIMVIHLIARFTKQNSRHEGVDIE
ncbi:MAG TPA: TRAP transporter small permease [Virgibacillus sp.]|nr:TRAP transporter small permease [Virgibacillus sp.]HLR68266.1 TRAP transporter small permease [Virgibacillus sp.]